MIMFGGMYVVDTRELAVDGYDTLIKGGLKGVI
jgi:hypothetical protein